MKHGTEGLVNPMIVAKTRMRRIPKTCKECKLSRYDAFDDRICGITGKDCPYEIKPSGSVGFGKPGWCPLVELKEGESNE